jgi:hypothetical protein
VVRLDLSEISVYGDSKIIIEWLCDKGQLQVHNLEGWKERILKLTNNFHSISFQHIYREYNSATNTLSKHALQQAPGKIVYFQCVGEHEGPHLSLELF